MILNIILVYRGLSGGIEKFCRFALPAMAVLAIIVLVRVLTLGTPDPALPDRNVVNGLGWLWNPNFSKLTDFDTWLAAAGQIFFSLSVGFGVILNYASYLKKKDDIALSAFTAGATNELFEVGFGGLITLTAAFVFLGAFEVTGTFGLGFQTLPVVFEQMGQLLSLPMYAELTRDMIEFICTELKQPTGTATGTAGGSPASVVIQIA